MDRIHFRLGLAAAIIIGGGGTAQAQSSTTGGINGTVNDPDGKPLAGVTVTVTSAQISRTTLTAADGSFRVGLLNPGAWTLSIAKPGLSTFRQQVNVVTNQVTPLTVKMQPEAKATVEVVAAAVGIDTTTTTLGQTYSSETIATLPAGRDFNSLAFFAPGVVTGGFGNDPAVGGGSSAENTYIVDGLNTTDFRRGFQGQSLDTNFIDQYEVQTGGFKPEFSALGGVFNAITKSGTNDFKGSAWVNVDPRSLKAERVKGQYYKQAMTTDRYDLGSQVGGALIKDKLFYFVGLSYIGSKSPNDTNRNQLEDGGITDKQTQVLGKLNWYLNPDQQLTFFLNLNNGRREAPRARPLDGDANWGDTQKSTTSNVTLNYDWTISPSLFLSAKAGTTELKDEITPEDQRSAIDNGNWYRTGPGFQAGNIYNVPQFGTASAPLWWSGGYGSYDALSKNSTTQLKVDLSWFVGDHNLKFGVAYLDTKYKSIQATTGGVWHRIRGTSPTDIYLRDQVNTTNATVETVFTSLYAQDSWSLADSGVKLMYGFRYEQQDLKDYRGRTYLKFDDFGDLIQPRLGFTWDLKKDGTMKLAGSLARYFESIPQRLGIRVFANEVFTRTRYNSVAAPAPNTGSFDYNFTNGSFTYNPDGPNNGFTDYATPYSFDPIAEGTKLPERREITLGFDWQFSQTWTAGVHYKYRKMLNPIEDSVITDADGIGLPDDTQGGVAILWNPHPGRVTYRMQPFNGGGLVSGESLFPEAKNVFKSADLTLNYKTADASIGFSYTWSRLEGNYEGLVSSSNGQADNNITASWDYFPYVGYGLLPNDRTHVAKLFGSYRLVLGFGELNLGWNYSYQSGTPISMWDGTNDIGGYGNATPLNGQLGQLGRTPAIQNLDLHTELQVKAGRLKVVPSIDVFNVGNARKELSQVQQATDSLGVGNPAYQAPRTWQQGRLVRFGVKLQF
ncbi:MAG: TonB-dependent receptor:Cna B-type [Holophagaceae bacterium]|nr:TonB-dependent receptor:Cna B-type [Holophagaceae bacterium]